MNSIEIIKFLEKDYPKAAAYDWDNVGLQVGTLNSQVKRVLVTLDVTKEVVKEAIDKKVNLILSHHPLIFKPLMNVTIETPKGWTVSKLIQHKIALYSMHTNFDVSDGGMNDVFADLLGMQNKELLDDLNNIGRIGDINPITFDDFVKKLHEEFKIEDIKLIGNPRETISRIGFSLGSGSHHAAPAKKKNADVYLTGDVTYHTALDAIEMGLTILDIGHHAEKIFIQFIKDKISQEFPEIEVYISEINTNPYKRV